MEMFTTVGLDIAKQVFQRPRHRGTGVVVGRRKLRRDYLPPCLISIEASAT